MAEDSEEVLYAMALTRICNFNFSTSLALYRAVGGAKALYDNRNNLGDILPNCTSRLMEAMKNWGEALDRAGIEMEFADKHAISILPLASDEYPQRLKDCPDAPIVLYYRGSTTMNRQRVIDIVGTRRCTNYGKDLIRRFVADLKLLCPDVLVVSGLAYGVDVNAHRAALDNGYDTIGVLAHGLDQLYPARHREIAMEMLSHGGLLTEFMSQTNADKANFVRRNRIVAGISDATILVESAAKGGGLITCSIAQGYGRDVFAFPGAVGMQMSEGCNRLIANNGAALITCAEDFVKGMGWGNDAALAKAQAKGIARDLFPTLSDEEQRVVSLLSMQNDLLLNVISVKAEIPIASISMTMFGLEMKGVVKPLAGGAYHLIV